MKKYFALLGVIIFMDFSATAFADCEMRPTTEREAEYFRQTFAALKSVLPAAPTGWTQQLREGQVEKFVCESDPEGNFDVRVSAAYTYHMPKEESDRRYSEFRMIDREIDKLSELPPDVAKERQVWTDKMSVANRASNRAYKEGDKKLASRLSDEADGYGQKGNEIRAKYLASIQPKVEQLEAKRKTIHYGDVIVNVSITANEHDAERITPERASELTSGKMPKGNKTSLKVQAIRAIVEGSMPERDVILNAIERDRLDRLVR
jgi:hypothetical protein